MDEIDPYIFPEIDIKYTDDTLRIIVARSGALADVPTYIVRLAATPTPPYMVRLIITLILFLCIRVLTGIDLVRNLEAFLGVLALSYMASGLVMPFLKQSGNFESKRYVLRLSSDQIEFTGDRSKTLTEPLTGVELRREGHDSDGYSLFTLWLIFRDQQVPTIERLTKEEGKYLSKLISHFMQLGDELFYPAYMDEETPKKKQVGTNSEQMQDHDSTRILL